MSSALYRLGSWAFRARRAVIALWLVLLVVLGASAGLLQKGFDNSVSIPGTESQAALDQLKATFPQVSGASAQVLVLAPEGADVRADDVAATIRDAADAIAGVEHVAAVSTPYTDPLTGDDLTGDAITGASDDHRAALLTVTLDGPSTTVTDATKEELRSATATLAQALPEGWDATLGGELFASEFPGLTLTEVLGVVVALIVLMATLGSFVAAGMPLLNAILGVAVSMLLVVLATAVTPVTSTTPMLALMLGLAVGIDYALFIVSRHRELLADGLDPREAAARSVATSGSAVVFAGLTVMIALVGLGVAGIPFLTTMGVAGAAAVGISVIVSLTMVPALFGFAGERLRPRPSRRTRRAAAAGKAAVPSTTPSRASRFFTGWVNLAVAKPWVTIVLVLGAVAGLALPALNLRLALPDAGVLPESSSARVTYERISDHYGPGSNGPLIITGSVLTSDDPLGLAAELADELRALPGVADVPLATPNESADTVIVQVVPESGPNDQETADLVQAIRDMRPEIEDRYDVDISVTGYTAGGIDVSAKLGAALLPFGIFVVGLSLVLLTMVFRSVAVPLKATLGYLLSVLAAFGVVTAVFENGIAAELLNVGRLGPVISFMPIILMGVLFGLAMDYEVFLVSRIREDYVHGRNARAAIRSGFAGSAKVVTAAAVIMIAVFFAFVPEGDVNIKPIALGLAVGVAVDAFLVRMTLVPAVLELLGERAWWMPAWLDRALPSFDVEGEGLHRELSLAGWPGEGTAVAARGLELAPRADVATAIDLEVPERGVLVVDGPARAVTGLLLTLAGRVRPEGGDLKVDDLVLPERAATVRRRAAWLDARRGDTRAVDAALREKPRVLVVDHAHHLHGDARAGAALAAAVQGGTTLVLGTTDPDVLPPGVTSTHLLTLTKGE